MWSTLRSHAYSLSTVDVFLHGCSVKAQTDYTSLGAALKESHGYLFISFTFVHFHFVVFLSSWTAYLWGGNVNYCKPTDQLETPWRSSSDCIATFVCTAFSILERISMCVNTAFLGPTNFLQCNKRHEMVLQTEDHVRRWEGVSCERIHFNFISVLHITDSWLHFKFCFIPLFDFFCLYLCDSPVMALTLGINNTDIISYQLFFSTCSIVAGAVGWNPELMWTWQMRLFLFMMVSLWYFFQASDKCAKNEKVYLLFTEKETEEIYYFS